jgi:hypothetical protein
MLLCALSLALLALVAGMMLLNQTKKENLNNFYKFVSWFVIVIAFLSILCVGARSAMRCCPMHREMEMREYNMMDRGDMMMGHMRGHGMMGHREMRGSGCEMMGGCCNEGGMSGCNEGMGQCNEGMSECHEGKDGGSCPMMKGDMHEMHEKMEMKDSVKKK